MSHMSCVEGRLNEALAVVMASLSLVALRLMGASSQNDITPLAGNGSSDTGAKHGRKCSAKMDGNEGRKRGAEKR